MIKFICNFKFDVALLTNVTNVVDINDCVPNPCANGGTCTDGVDSYTCDCAAGYTGPNCDVSE